MSSSYVVLIKEPAWDSAPRSAMLGPSEPESVIMHKLLEFASAPVPDGKSKKQQVAPCKYVLYDKWTLITVIRQYYYRHPVCIDAEDREYNSIIKLVIEGRRAAI
jgi:hypothetical protein